MAKELRGNNRLIITHSPNESADPLTSSAMEGAITNSKLSVEWINKMREKPVEEQQSDPFFKELVAQYNKLKSENFPFVVTVDWRNVTSSFIWNKLRLGDPFGGVAPFSERHNSAPPMSLRFDEDSDFVACLDFLNNRAKPWHLIHLPDFRTEFSEGKEYAFQPASEAHEKNLLGSLWYHKGVLGLNKYLETQDIEVDKMYSTPTASHPNKDAWVAYAQAVADVLLEKYDCLDAQN